MRHLMDLPVRAFDVVAHAILVEDAIDLLRCQ
jgi:hypothetical protein